MIINNFIEFAKFASDLQLNGLDSFNNYYGGYNNICACKPTLKQLYYDRCDEQYIIYLKKNHDYIKEKLILAKKNTNHVFLHLGSKEILRIIF